eukprot:gene3754-4276_t
MKSYEDGYYDDEDYGETKHLNSTDEVDSSPFELSEKIESSQDSLSSKTGSSSIVDETNTTAIQPNVKSVVGPILSNITQDITQRSGNKSKPMVTVVLDYCNTASRLRVTLLEAVNLPRPKSGSSEPYIDMQLTPYKRRTYRPPGYRRPLRGCLKKPADLTIESTDLQNHYLLLFMLRYDPFSRLKVDGEAMKFLQELDGLIDEQQISINLELQESDQQFTGFIFRHGASTRSLNGSTRSHNGSTRSPGVKRCQDDSLRSSTRSYNGFSLSKTESAHDHGYGEDKMRASSRSFAGFSRPSGDEIKLWTPPPERKFRESPRLLNTSSLRHAGHKQQQQQSGLTKDESGMMREDSSPRSFSQFSRTRGRSALPLSGLTKSFDEVP